MQILKVVDLKDALNHRGKAIVITPDLKDMYDMKDFGQDFSFLCKLDGQPASMMTMKEAFNYKGKGNVRAISPDMVETMSLDEFQDGFYFLILTSEESVSKVDPEEVEEMEEEKPRNRRHSRKLEEDDEEIDVTFDD